MEADLSPGRAFFRLQSIASGKTGEKKDTWLEPGVRQAPIGIEPMHEAFAELSLTAWVRRQSIMNIYGMKDFVKTRKSISLLFRERTL